MKQCPQCQKVYFDEALNFCVDDGTTLVQARPPEEETIQLPRRTAPARVPAPASTARVSRSGVSPMFAYLAIGLISLIIGGALVAWVMSNRNSASRDRASGTNTAADRDRTNQNTNETDRPSPTPSASPTPSPVTSASPAQIDTAEAKEEVQAALDGWLEALNTRDLDARMASYADRLDTYYTKKNVGVASVRSENIKAFSRFSDMEMNISNLKTDVDERTGEVVTTFDKSFNFQGDNGNFEGEVRSEFRWKKIGGQWKIIGERDLKVY